MWVVNWLCTSFNVNNVLAELTLLIVLSANNSQINTNWWREYIYKIHSYIDLRILKTNFDRKYTVLEIYDPITHISKYTKTKYSHWQRFGFKILNHPFSRSILKNMDISVWCVLSMLDVCFSSFNGHQCLMLIIHVIDDPCWKILIIQWTSMFDVPFNWKAKSKKSVESCSVYFSCVGMVLSA